MVFPCGFRSISCASEKIGSSVPPVVPERWCLELCNASGRVHRLRPAQKLGAVTLVFAGHFAPGFDNHRMDQHNRFFIRRARAALEQERILIGEIFALDKKFVEGRMPPVGSLRRQHHFAVTGQFQPAGRSLSFRMFTRRISTPSVLMVIPVRREMPLIRTLELHLVRIKQHFLMLRRAFQWAGRWLTRALRSRGLAHRSTCPTGQGWCRHASASAQTRATGCIRRRRW